MGFGVLADAAAANFLDLLDAVEVDAVRIVDVTVGIGERDDLRAQLGRLFAGVDGHVAGAGDHDRCAVEALAGRGEHLLGEVAQAVAGGLLARQRTAVGQALAGQHAAVIARQALVLAVEIADLARADADVAGRNVGIRALSLIHIFGCSPPL